MLLLHDVGDVLLLRRALLGLDVGRAEELVLGRSGGALVSGGLAAASTVPRLREQAEAARQHRKCAHDQTLHDHSPYLLRLSRYDLSNL